MSAAASTATTRNGGLNVTLSGDRWDGEGLDVETSNGGVTVTIPDGYNAELETRTVNGGLRIDFPITVQGELTRAAASARRSDPAARWSAREPPTAASIFGAPVDQVVSKPVAGNP